LSYFDFIYAESGLINICHLIINNPGSKYIN
jgi:hypothetical protein